MRSRGDLWSQNALLLLVLGLLGYLYATRPEPVAHAAGGGWDTNGVMAMTTEPNERLILIDTSPSKQNICVYKVLGQGQFRLVGARSYKYDVEIKDSKDSLIEKTANGVTYGQVKQLYESKEKSPK